MTRIGYARVSTEDQDLAPQLDALRAAGCVEVFEEHASGASRAQPQLAAALARVRRGDTLMVARIDRLARSLSHLHEVVEALRAAGAHFRSLADPIDTAGPSGVLVLQMLGAVAEFERALIPERTTAGLAAAKSRGRVGGNPGLRAGDPAALAKLAGSRRAGRVADLLPGSDKGLLAPAPRRRTRRGAVTRSRAVDVAAAPVAGRLGMTLSGLGAELARLRHAPPRGGRAWAPSSLKALLDRTRAQGLLAPPG